MSMFEFLLYESPDSWLLLESRNSPIEHQDDRDDDGDGMAPDRLPTARPGGTGWRLFRHWRHRPEAQAWAGVGR
jgi:hypothetical protein